MANTKISAGYQGTYAKAADGSPVLVMVSKSESIAGDKPAIKEQSMSEENKKYVPYTTEQKRNTQSNLPRTKSSPIAKDSGAHTRIWGISAGAIHFSSTTI